MIRSLLSHGNIHGRELVSTTRGKGLNDRRSLRSSYRGISDLDLT
jgi:hypothetical protein